MSERLPDQTDWKPVIAGAEDTIACFLVTPLSVVTYRALLQRARAGVRVEFILLQRAVSGLGLTAAYLDKLRATGGRYFVVNPEEKDWKRLRLRPQNQLLVDGQSMGLFEAATFHALQQLGEQPSEDLLKSLLTDDKGYTLGQVLISPQFSASKNRVLAGEPVKLSWSAPADSEVVIAPFPGRVAPVGECRIALREATEFTLWAACRGAKASRVLRVAVDHRLRLKYWLVAGETREEQRSRRLQSPEDLPDHYGLAAGEPLTLHWSTENATDLLLDGTSLPLPRGQRQLWPADLSRYELCCRSAQGEEMNRTLTIKTFPSPTQVQAKLPPVTEVISRPEATPSRSFWRQFFPWLKSDSND